MKKSSRSENSPGGGIHVSFSDDPIIIQVERLVDLDASPISSSASSSSSSPPSSLSSSSLSLSPSSCSCSSESSLLEELYYQPKDYRQFEIDYIEEEKEIQMSLQEARDKYEDVQMELVSVLSRRLHNGSDSYNCWNNIIRNIESLFYLYG